MEHFLFAGYLLLFAWLVTKVKFFTTSGLSKPQLIIFFFLKVLAGIFYGWIGIYYGQLAKMVDTWAYHYESIRELDSLKHTPFTFFTDIFHSNYPEGYSRFLVSDGSWWNDLKANFLIKVFAIFNLFSFSHYYINVIFYSFLTFFGPIALFRVMTSIFPSAKIVVMLFTFLIPSFLYWDSGLHKEGLIFTGFALISYFIYFGLKQKRFGTQRIAGIVLGLLLIIIFRNFLIIVLVPALIAWILAEKYPLYSTLKIYCGVYSLFLIMFFGIRYIFPVLDFPLAVVIKQNDFILLNGGSSVPVQLIEPTFYSFIQLFPQALTLSCIRPYPSDVRHLLSMAASAEINFLLLLFLIFLVWHKKTSIDRKFILYCLALSFSVLIMVGYSVNNLGAIVRYRSIILPFIIVPLAAAIDWKRIGEFISGTQTMLTADKKNPA